MVNFNYLDISSLYHSNLLFHIFYVAIAMIVDLQLYSLTYVVPVFRW